MKTKKTIFLAGSLSLLMLITMLFTFGAMAAENKKDVQNIEATVTAYGYPDITVAADKPVRINFKVAAGDLNACNNEITIPEWNITKKLAVGDNYVEFTPSKEGTYGYTCWMGMISAKITVVGPGSADIGATVSANSGYNGYNGCGMAGSGYGGNAGGGYGNSYGGGYGSSSGGGCCGF